MAVGGGNGGQGEEGRPPQSPSEVAAWLGVQFRRGTWEEGASNHEANAWSVSAWVHVGRMTPARPLAVSCSICICVCMGTYIYI